MTSSRAWPRTRSLRTRIVTTTALLTLVAMAALVALTALVLDRANDADVRSMLQGRAEAVAAATVRPDGTLNRTPDLSNVTDDVAWIYDDAGAQVYGPSGSDLDRSAADLRTATAPAVSERDDWLLLAQPLPRDVGVVVVGASLRPYKSTRDNALLVAGVLGALVVAAVTALTAWTVTRALRPVASMARSAAAWSEQHLDRRFDLGPPYDEITELGAVLDGLLARVARALVAEQRLTSELAHELRTPLTVVRAEAELALDEPGVAAGDSARLERIVAATEHMTSVIDSLLSAARGAPTTGAAVPVDDLFHQVTTGPSLGAVGVEIVVEGDDRLFVATPIDVASRALSPLLTNAVQYASTRVTLRARDAGPAVAIEVDDDGPGVSPDEQEIVFTPGRRAPDSPGAGLGLPLARRLARASGGDVRLEAGRPTRFVLTLPKASRPRS
jgi:two-component system, OmpR family, sensor kinase